MRRVDTAPNWWGWGWGPGHQETAEFDILEAYFTAAHLITKRIETIEHPNYILSDHPGYWKLFFTDETSQLVVA